MVKQSAICFGNMPFVQKNNLLKKKKIKRKKIKKSIGKSRISKKDN